MGEEVIWQDLLISRDVSDPDLGAAIATVLNVSPDDVIVFDPECQRLSDLSEDARVVCDRMPLRGDFKLHLGFILRDPDVATYVKSHDEVQLLHTICRKLDVEGLISDPGNNPYAGLYLPHTGEPSYVDLDADRMDNDEYVILRVGVAT